MSAGRKGVEAGGEGKERWGGSWCKGEFSGKSRHAPFQMQA